MKTKLSLYIIFILILFASCKNSTDVKNNIAAKNICDKLQGQKFELSYWKQTNPFKRNYIEYDLSNPKALTDKIIDSATAISFCAIELYRNLCSSTIKENDGIKIGIGNKKNTKDVISPLYYYDMQYLGEVNKSVTAINAYLNSVINHSYEPINNYIDTTIINPDSVNIMMKKLLFNYNNASFYYSFTETEIQIDSNKIFQCFPFVVQIQENYSGKALYLRIITRKADYKIVGISTNV